MAGLYTTPTEALLQVAQQHPFTVVVKCREDQWSYAALWARVRQIADKIPDLGDTGNSIGLHMGLEIDYVAAAHAIWLSGRTVVFLSSKWTPEVLQAILERANVRLILFGSLEPPALSGIRAVSTLDLAESQHPPSHVVPPPPSEAVEVVPLVSSITPTSGSTGVPKSIVYPMRRSLEVLSEESSTLLQPMDGQWLRGGTTFLRPLFEIRRFMFNQTTLYLDASTSVAAQCSALCEELESTYNSQLLRVHFTPSVFRAFADFAQMRSGGSQLPKGFNRVYWMVIGGESLSTRDLELARVVFPSATIACNYACSEVGFAGISQMFVRPADPMPSVISFGPTHGCTDLVLLDESLSVIPKTQDGATGIVAFITRQSATYYLANDEASRHMFRPWNGDDMLLYTDDIGCMQADGTITIRGRSSRNVKINGLFVDLDYVERALAPAFADKSLNVSSFKLVKSCATEKIVLFACTETTDALFILKHARDCLRVSLNDDLAMVIGSVRCISEMPFNASYKVDLATLQKLADSTVSLAPGLFAELPTVASPASKVDALAEKIAAEIAKLSKSSETIPTDMPLLYSGLNSITVIRLYMWLQSEYEYVEEMTHLFEEEVTAQVLANEILCDEITEESDADVLADEIAAEITKLSKSTEAVPKDMPLLYSGLNSITMVRLHMWLQSEHEYEEEMSHLFDEEVTAQVLAREIQGHDSMEDGSTQSGTDTVVEDGASEVHVLEKDLDFATQVYDSAAREALDETRDFADEDAGYQILIITEDDSEDGGKEVESEHGPQVIMSCPKPKSPMPNLKSPNLLSPSRCAFSFNDIPESPSVDQFSYMFSSWLTPLPGEARWLSLMDSVLMLTV
ncbi:hypothetical protein V8E55_012084 [Tylopilus felleus]